MSSRKPSVCRQKIKMAKIKNQNHLQVTFSKRRSGLFKKASELATLCGVDIAAVVFSPAGKVYSFGHPNVESLVARFMSRDQSTDSNSVVAHSNNKVKEMNSELTRVLAQLEEANKYGESLDLLRKANEEVFWWEKPIENLGTEELLQLKDSMEELKKDVESEAKRVRFETVPNANGNLQGFGEIGTDGVNVFDLFESKSSVNYAADFHPATGSGFF